MTLEEVKKIVNHSLEELEDLNFRNKLNLALVDPVEKTIDHFDASNVVSQCQVCVVFDVQERDVVLLYSSGGYALDGFPWGISFRGSKDSGPPSCWYRSLEECARDSGYFD